MFIEITHIEDVDNTHVERALINTDHILFLEKEGDRTRILMSFKYEYYAITPNYEDLAELLLNPPVTVTSGYSVPEWYCAGPSVPLPEEKE